jgi:hypothetical protein
MHTDGSPLRHDDFLRNRETKAGAADLGARDAKESIKELILIADRDSRPMIDHGKAHAAAMAPGRQRHLSSGFGVLDRIRDKVEKTCAICCASTATLGNS